MKRVGFARIVVLAAVASVATSQTVGAQQPELRTASGATPSSAAVQQTSPLVRFRWQDHPTIRIGRVDLALRARVQVDSRTSDAGTTSEDELALDFARKRVGLEGRLRGYFEFQIERELDTSSDPWRDAYVNYNQFDAVQVQAGKFKIPFGLDENTGATNLDFVYRAMASSTLAPGRDRGYMLHGRLLDGALVYEAGLFDHDGRNARPRSGSRVFGGRTRAGRVQVEPARAFDAPVQLGAAWARTTVAEGFSAIRGRTVFGRSFFSSDYPVLGERERIGVEARFRPGPFQLQAEWIRMTEERQAQSVEDGALSPIRSEGWYASASWAVTGQKKADGLGTVKNALFQGGVGAIEVAARIESLRFDSGQPDDVPSTSPRADRIVGNRDRAQTFGVNWYVNRWVKVQINLIKETLQAPELGPLPSRASFWSRVFRLQFTL